MEMKHTTPHFIALAVLAIGLPWFFLLSDEDHRLLPSLFVVVEAAVVVAADFIGPPALPDPLAAQDPEPWKRPAATNAQEAQADQAWVAQSTTAAQVAPSALTTPAAPALSQPQAANVAQPLTNEAVAQQDLFAEAEEEKRQRLEQLDRAMDAIRDKYGKGAIGRASTPKGMDRERHAPPPGGAYHPK